MCAGCPHNPSLLQPPHRIEQSMDHPSVESIGTHAKNGV